MTRDSATGSVGPPFAPEETRPPAGPADRYNVQTAISALLKPLDYETKERYRRAVAQAFKAGTAPRDILAQVKASLSAGKNGVI